MAEKQSTTKVRRRARREGTIFRRKSDGRWCASITLSYTDGKLTRKAFYGKTRNEVSDALKDALARQVRGETIPIARDSVGEHLDHWLAHSIKPHRKASTVKSYSARIRTYLKPELGIIKLTKLTPRRVQVFVNDLVSQGLKPRTVAYTLQVLRMALDTAVDQRLIAFNPATKGIRKPRASRKEIEPMTVEQANAVLRAVEGHRLGAMFVLMLHTGLRRAETLGLRWCDLDLDAGVVRVRQTAERVDGEFVFSEPKTDKSRREISGLPPIVLNALRKWRFVQNGERGLLGLDWGDRHGLVFTKPDGTPIADVSVNRILDSLLKQAGLAHMRVHDLRHACATLLDAAGVPLKTISTILGHSSIRITSDLYIHTSQQTIRDAMTKLDQFVAIR
jgi:integrase